MTALSSLMPIVGALAGGWAASHVLPHMLRRGLIRLIGPLVWLLLFLIGMEFGAVLSSVQALGSALYKASVLALFTTLVPCLLIWLLLRRTRSQIPAPRPEAQTQTATFWQPVKECGIALSMVALGGLAFVWMPASVADAHPLPSSWTLLLILIVLVGVDLGQVDLKGRLWSFKAFATPLLVVLGSLLGACAAAWVTGEALQTALALASGFGWFSLSSVMIGDALGQDYGTIALMTDLLRELLAIVILYMAGMRYPLPAVGSAAATALDTTLPIVKQTCAPDIVPLALVSGFILTVLAPLMIMAFLAG
ncbi:lysine exporter LysO family protein [Kerstersia sp.]|uniref:lysine exporter LysO family protein n=1 Tax=Kerstersia sp. TaxID=1930783 RepID=UPI003F8F6545